METKKVLVVTVSQGFRDSLVKTIHSVNGVNNGDIHHLVVVPNDQIVVLQQTHPYVKFLSQPYPDKGLYATLNTFISEHSEAYSYVAYLNDDDFWYPEFRKLISYLDNHPNIQAAYGRVNFVNTTAEVIASQACSSRYSAFKTLYQGDIVLFTQQAVLIRSEVYKKLNGFDESYQLIADTDFWIRAIAENFQFKYIDLIVAAYARHRYQLSNNLPLLEAEKNILFDRMETDSAIKIKFEKTIFRLQNLPLYLKRLGRYGHIQLSKIIKSLDRKKD